MEHQHEHFEVHENKRELPEKKFLDYIRQWSQPLLILIVGYLLSDKMTDIKEQLRVITTLQLSQAQMRVEMDGVKKDLNRLEDRQDEDDRLRNDMLYNEAQKRLKIKVP